VTWLTYSREPELSVRAALTVLKVRLGLAQEEASDLAAGRGPEVQHDDVSPSVWLSSGLEHEDQQ
jgi:hypothetical protein